MDLPLIRHSERVDFKRCPKKWFWHWRMGLFPKTINFGALVLGTWTHAALAGWYGLKHRDGHSLSAWFERYADADIARAIDLPDYVMEQAEEARGLGLAMTTAYQKRYGADDEVNVMAVELPLEFEITDEEGTVIAHHKLKPDMVYENATTGDVWLMEHKTAKQIRLEHLPIDDQARPYAAMAEVAMRRAGVLAKSQQFKGVMYNFLRKALPDERPVNEKGQALNKNGTISAKQPSPVFVRHPVVLSRKAKQIALMRLRDETMIITHIAARVRDKTIAPSRIPKTSHSSCPKLCQYFAMCVVEEQGGDIKTMQQTMYVRHDPYTYDEETTDIPASFELS